MTKESSGQLRGTRRRVCARLGGVRVQPASIITQGATEVLQGAEFRALYPIDSREEARCAPPTRDLPGGPAYAQGGTEWIHSRVKLFTKNPAASPNSQPEKVSRKRCFVPRYSIFPSSWKTSKSVRSALRDVFQPMSALNVSSPTIHRRGFAQDFPTDVATFQDDPPSAWQRATSYFDKSRGSLLITGAHCDIQPSGIQGSNIIDTQQRGQHPRLLKERLSIERTTLLLYPPVKHSKLCTSSYNPPGEFSISAQGFFMHEPRSVEPFRTLAQARFNFDHRPGFVMRYGIVKRT
ncbi:hypothetical protein KM043_008724 [Ampulex compressa]|nr:hypothetical protein KM043_008724 [Ampulex compressa]